MQYQSDYILRLIEQMGSLIRRAMERAGIGSDEEPLELLSEAIGLALDMDPALAARLSPQSLVSLVELNSVDDRVLALLADALEGAATALESDGELLEAGLRREQAGAVRQLLDPTRAN